jgi:SAM-dependent methyltransferase
MPDHAMLAATERQDPLSQAHSTLSQVLHAVFGERWVGQQHFTTTAELDALHAALRAGVGTRVLDIGSGLGGPAIYLARQRGSHVTGLDASAESVRRAQAAAVEAGLAHRVNFVAGDILTAAFPAGAFAAIVSHGAFMTIANKAHLFAQCRHWLRPGGRLAATLIVSRGSLAARAYPPPFPAWPIPTADDYRRLAEQAGLRICALDDVTRSFREVCARWRGALVVWDLALLQRLPPDAFALSPATIAQVAEWSAQGMVGQIRMVVEREGRR